jgi:hypothetical protein
MKEDKSMTTNKLGDDEVQACNTSTVAPANI